MDRKEREREKVEAPMKLIELDSEATINKVGMAQSPS
jgi:hypothetical protein